LIRFSLQEYLNKMPWIPLEANPDTMNKYVWKLGVSKDWNFTDIYAMDDEILETIPTPVLAVVLLHPLKNKESKTASGDGIEASGDIILIEQTIENACGTVAILHALMNNYKALDLDKSEYLKGLHAKLKSLSPEERAKVVEGEGELSCAHEETALQGQTAAPDANENTELHFVTFVHNNGRLYELDGRKKAPTNHGTTSDSALLKDTALVIKKVMERDPEAHQFSVIALCKAANT